MIEPVNLKYGFQTLRYGRDIFYPSLHMAAEAK